MGVCVEDAVGSSEKDLGQGGEKMERFVRFMVGLCFGAAVGVALVVLLAPQSGEETRQRIQEKVDAVLMEGQRAAEERRLELLTQFEELKKPMPRT